MNNADRIILVTGATGNQGGATARHLLVDGWRVHALTRDASSAAAQALARAGARIVTGDLNDRASLERALQSVYGVFSVQRTELPGRPDGFTVDDEIRQGIALADAAKAAGVKHFIYTSVGAAERDSGIPFWESKWTIEKHIHALGLPATILRPVTFAENFASPYFGVQTGALTFFLDPDVPTQVVAVDDIGAFAALVFGNPNEYIGQAFEFAGDSLSYSQIAAAIGRALGRQITYAQYPSEVVQGQPWLAAALAFSKRDRWRADIPALRRRLPSLQSFDEWLAGEGGSKLRALVEAPTA